MSKRILCLSAALTALAAPAFAQAAHDEHAPGGAADAPSQPAPSGHGGESGPAQHDAMPMHGDHQMMQRGAGGMPMMPDGAMPMRGMGERGPGAQGMHAEETPPAEGPAPNSPPQPMPHSAMPMHGDRQMMQGGAGGMPMMPDGAMPMRGGVGERGDGAHGAHAEEAPPAAEDHSAHAAEAPSPGEDHAAHDTSAMTGALGAYSMTREASGTAWQPDASTHAGIHAQRGGWDLMGHALLNGVFSTQSGPRGDEFGYLAGMVMGSARRDLANGDALQLRAMLSPDPLMGRRGYPLLLAAGETADGVNTLVDRQHPHDFFMELSASYSHRLNATDSVFIYAGLPGEPAFGPPAFMHRLSIMDSPEAPITHHWLDSTHIVFGVVTAGIVLDDVKIEASAFKGREPDEDRWDIDHPELDSFAARLSWNPTDTLSLQTSWAHAKDVEQLSPGEDVTKWSASAIYTRPVGENGLWSTTLSWGRRDGGHESLDAFALESALKPDDAWTVFARAEQTETNELTTTPAGHHGPVFDVAKVSAGVVHDWRVAEHAKFGIGALYSLNFVPAALEPLYGGDPDGGMVFLHLSVG